MASTRGRKKSNQTSSVEDPVVDSDVQPRYPLRGRSVSNPRCQPPKQGTASEKLRSRVLGKRKSAPEALEPQTDAKRAKALGRSPTPRYNLRHQRPSMGASGMPTAQQTPAKNKRGSRLVTPPSVRYRDPSVSAGFDDLPSHLLKAVCQHLDPADVLAARVASTSLRDACIGLAVPLRFTLPMQNTPWLSIQLETWERRIRGVAGMLQSGKIQAAGLQLRMEGGDTWKISEGANSAEMDANPRVKTAVMRLKPLLSGMIKLAPSASTLQLDIKLPCTAEVLGGLNASLPGVQSLRLDNLICAPHNHLAAFTPAGTSSGRPQQLFPDLRKLDVLATAWDQLQHLASCTGLTDLSVRHSMWNVPELTWATGLTQLTTMQFQVVDDRSTLQLDCLAPLKALRGLKHLKAGVILSRAVPAAADGEGLRWLSQMSALETLDLDLRVTQDAARVAHLHLKNLRSARPNCKVNVVVRADQLMREQSYDNAGSCLALLHPRAGAPLLPDVEAVERWSYLDMSTGHTGTLQSVHFTGYKGPLRTLPDLTCARLTQLQVSNACLSPRDFQAIGSCSLLEHLYVSFIFAPSMSAAARAGRASVSRDLNNRKELTASAASEALWRYRSDPSEPRAASEGQGGSYEVLGSLTRLHQLQSLEVKEEAAPCVRLRLKVAEERACGMALDPGTASSSRERLARDASSMVQPGADGSTIAQHTEHMAASLKLAASEGQTLLPTTGSDFDKFMGFLAHCEQMASLSLQFLEGDSYKKPTENLQMVISTWTNEDQEVPFRFWRLALGKHVMGSTEIRPKLWPREEGFLTRQSVPHPTAHHAQGTERRAST